MTESYGVRLARLNGLDAAVFAAWEFLPGMRFAEGAAWWREGPGRATPHEGLDLRLYRRADGRVESLPPGTLVPAALPGTVVAVVEDFLGRSVFVAHGPGGHAGKRLHTVYGHVEPRADLAVGAEIGDGEPVGAVADPAARASRVPPHLHLTLALISGPGPLDWPALRDPSRAVLLDPLPLLCDTMPARR